jgi:transcriptional regulator with XRE-family HTH domain
MKQGMRLRHWRKAKGWTQRQLADYIGTSSKTIIRWEAGDNAPPWRLVWLALTGHPNGMPEYVD